jgi:hypothetical protein
MALLALPVTAKKRRWDFPWLGEVAQGGPARDERWLGGGAKEGIGVMRC